MQNVKMSKGGKIGRWVGGSQNLHPFHSLQILLKNVPLLPVPPKTFKRTIKRKENTQRSIPDTLHVVIRQESFQLRY